MRENSEILSDPARSDREHSAAALKILQDLCISFETFVMLDLPDLLGSDRDVVCDQVDDTAWLVSVGRSLHMAMLSEGLEWPPPGQNPPSMVRDLSTMYSDAIKPEAPTLCFHLLHYSKQSNQSELLLADSA
jgi:hypothetical protein